MTYRLSINEITSDQLDALYQQLEARESAIATYRAQLRLEQARIARVRRLIDEHPVAVGTHLLEEALDEPPVHNAGPSLREAAANDRLWPLEKHGE
ncbi:hypothetical protein [Streptomyces coeruleorubidus]|uniref:Uncharacterized protein n=1 Tax=Streptomyces coeruleorubidus TaxID=116188 RepID=A0A5J6I4G0_STRC4|nr:hypothetical protein [Streptomyces coeruleorubidus]QEV23987.1 hypothetical protein CP976_07390 [Streptomyces coeruleorubidus]GGT85582.1 hypothetical protein GCM10010256_52110 [Streptomyces coeruleorubidus]